MLDGLRNIFRSTKTASFDNLGEYTETVKPSPFKGHVVTPMKNAVSRAGHSAVGEKAKSFFSAAGHKIGNAALWCLVGDKKDMSSENPDDAAAMKNTLNQAVFAGFDI